jgi:hypothetical protein
VLASFILGENMREHIIPSIVASVVAVSAAIGAIHFAGPSHVTQVVTAPAGSVSPAKAARIAKTVWPELSQAEVDHLTSRLGILRPGKVTIFCIDDAKCGDLALNLENAFETAHWQVSVQNSPMVPPGIISSADLLVDAVKSSTDLPIVVDHVNKNAGPGEYIAIGAKP